MYFLLKRYVHASRVLVSTFASIQCVLHARLRIVHLPTSGVHEPVYILGFLNSCSRLLSDISFSSASCIAKHSSHCLALVCGLFPCLALALLNSCQVFASDTSCWSKSIIQLVFVHTCTHGTISRDCRSRGPMRSRRSPCSLCSYCNGSNASDRNHSICD